MSKPKILFFDIETAGVSALRSDLGFVLMFGMKWNYERKARVMTIRQKELVHFNDGPLLTRLSKQYVRADLVIGHFASVFDRRFLQGRLLINKLPPLPYTKMRDTCMIARSVANFSSNRLKNLGETLKLRHRKLEKGDGWPEWWFRSMQGRMDAIRDMANYCKGDVLAVEELYYRLRPFDGPHPRIYFGDEKCGNCGGEIRYDGKFSFMGQLRYRRHKCIKCGKWGRDRKAVR